MSHLAVCRLGGSSCWRRALTRAQEGCANSVNQKISASRLVRCPSRGRGDCGIRRQRAPYASGDVAPKASCGQMVGRLRSRRGRSFTGRSSVASNRLTERGVIERRRQATHPTSQVEIIWTGVVASVLVLVDDRWDFRQGWETSELTALTRPRTPNDNPYLFAVSATVPPGSPASRRPNLQRRRMARTTSTPGIGPHSFQERRTEIRQNMLLIQGVGRVPRDFDSSQCRST